jgi:hypothetical protein
MAIDFKKLAEKAVASGADQTKAQAGGGGDYTPPAAGPGLCRLIGYIELGKQKGTYQGKPTVKEKVRLIFELVGKRHAVEADEQPHRISVDETLSLSEKANFYKLFTRLNYKQEARHMAELLGQGFKCEVFHDKWTDRQGKERIDAVLRNEAGYSLAPPRKEDEDSETGWVDVAVPPARSDIRCFLWEHADLEQWGGLFIEGEYPERKNEKGEVTAPAKSKNVLQNNIKAAVNFQGSPIYNLLAANGQALDLPAPGEDPDEGGEGNESQPTGATGTSGTAAAPSTTSPSKDKLGGIV